MGLAEQILHHPGDGLSDEDQERAFFLHLEASHETPFGAHLSEGPRFKLIAAFELARRYAIFKLQTVSSVTKLQRVDLNGIAVQALQKVPIELRQSPNEWLGFIPYYRPGELGSFCRVENGVRSHVNFEPSELFARLLPLRAKAFVLVHHHPSGDLRASLQDLELTQRVQDLASALGVELLGHWIVGWQGEEWIPIHPQRCPAHKPTQ